MHIFLLESDRRLATILQKSLSARGCTVQTFIEADAAIAAADVSKPDIVIMELSLAGHSGLEFLYEFRTYNDWQDIPVIVYSSMLLDRAVREAMDWKLLNIADYLYKPDVSVQQLVDRTLELCEATAS
jgi:DNA-binding response OmpR family regulator